MITPDKQNYIIYMREILSNYKTIATANAKSDICYL